MTIASTPAGVSAGAFSRPHRKLQQVCDQRDRLGTIAAVIPGFRSWPVA